MGDDVNSASIITSVKCENGQTKKRRLDLSETLDVQADALHSNVFNPVRPFELCMGKWGSVAS